MEPLAVVTRNDYIESVHYGYICVTEATGKVLYHLGDFNTQIYFRSSAKPLQVIPLISSGAADAFGFSNKEIALACSSHSGQPMHQKSVQEILMRLDLQEKDLHCGIMQPYNEDENKKLLREGLSPSKLHCSCSGKHSAMLALSKFKGLAINDYEKISHPVQQEILATITEFADEDTSALSYGVDGCGAPIYLLPIHKIALSYAKLAKYAQETDQSYHNPCKRIFDAMTEYPEMVAGDYEFCTELMQASNGKLIGKVGCEAVYSIAIKKGNLGICIKIVDGNERAVYPVVVELLRQMDVLTDSEISKLKKWASLALKNNLDEQIGEVRPIFALNNKKINDSLLGKNINQI